MKQQITEEKPVTEEKKKKAVKKQTTPEKSAVSFALGDRARIKPAKS